MHDYRFSIADYIQSISVSYFLTRVTSLCLELLMVSEIQHIWYTLAMIGQTLCQHIVTLAIGLYQTLHLTYGKDTVLCGKEFENSVRCECCLVQVVMNLNFDNYFSRKTTIYRGSCRTLSDACSKSLQQQQENESDSSSLCFHQISW